MQLDLPSWYPKFTTRWPCKRVVAFDMRSLTMAAIYRVLGATWNFFWRKRSPAGFDMYMFAVAVSTYSLSTEFYINSCSY